MAEQYDENEGKTPVFVINGFLEAGKTQFLKFTIDQPYFQTEGKTLLLVCEEGEETFDDDLLNRTNTIAIFFENKEEATAEQFSALQKEYQPERVLIEWNGMWMQNELMFPEEWYLNQQITIINTRTMDLYLKNMRAFLGPMLKDTELVICNRADGFTEEQLGNYHLSLKGMAPNAEIVFEGKDGEIRGDFSINLPYDLKADHLEVGPEDYAIFYVDSMDRPDRYDGKTVEFTAQVMKPKGAPKNVFVPGRKVMTCCEADIQFAGLLSYYSGTTEVKTGDWVEVVAKVRAEYTEVYKEKGPVLYIKNLNILIQSSLNSNFVLPRPLDGSPRQRRGF